MSIFDEVMKREYGLIDAPDLHGLDDGKVLVFNRSDDLYMDAPRSIKFDPPSLFTDFVTLQRYGGIVSEPRHNRIIQFVPMPGMPEGLPGIEALLEDGWAWDGWHDVFKREGGTVSLARVKSGRYAERLPTNRKRAKARRKYARRQEAIAHGWHDGFGASEFGG